MPTLPVFAGFSGELSAPIDPEKDVTRSNAVRGPGVKPGESLARQVLRDRERQLKPTCHIVRVDQDLITAHGEEPRGVGEPCPVIAPRLRRGAPRHGGEDARCHRYRLEHREVRVDRRRTPRSPGSPPGPCPRGERSRRHRSKPCGRRSHEPSSAGNQLTPRSNLLSLPVRSHQRRGHPPAQGPPGR